MAKLTTIAEAHSVLQIRDRLEASEISEALKVARVFAMASMPRKSTSKRDHVRYFREGKETWFKVTYSAQRGYSLPFGEDRAVLFGAIHLALEQDDPVVRFDTAGELLTLFGIAPDGSSYHRLRERLRRLTGLSISVEAGSSREELEANQAKGGKRWFVFEAYSLPTRKELRSKSTQQILLPRESEDLRYGVKLGAPLWDYVREPGNRFLVPVAILQKYLRSPVLFDMAVFLIGRCGAAKSPSVVPHASLIEMFRTSKREEERFTVRRIRRAFEKVMLVLEPHVNAKLEVMRVIPSGGGRPKKEWCIRVAPSPGFYSGKVLTIEQKPGT